jgi:heat shock protein HspQ
MDSNRYRVGEIVDHIKYHYRAVIIEVDPCFLLDENWYQRVAVSRPPKEAPWYHLLVDGTSYQTYVAECHLVKALDPQQIEHPQLGRYFTHYTDGRYH